MSRVSELIDLIVQGKNAEASDVLNQELLNKTYQAINDFKPHVAADYFKSVADEIKAEEPESNLEPEPTEETTDEAD